jgi:hypothetical protein
VRVPKELMAFILWWQIESLYSARKHPPEHRGLVHCSLSGEERRWRRRGKHRFDFDLTEGAGYSSTRSGEIQRAAEEGTLILAGSASAHRLIL